MHLDIFLKLCHQQIQKMSLYDILITVNSGSKYDTQTNDPIFLIYSLGSIHRYISFLHFKTYQNQFHVVLVTLHYFLKCKIHVYKPKITPSSLLLQISVEISFFYIKFANFDIYDMLCSQFDTSLTLIPWFNTNIVFSRKKRLQSCSQYLETF